MSDDPSWAIQIGVKAPDLLAGFAGGIVNAFVWKRSSLVAIAGSVIVGTLSANYLAETFKSYLAVVHFETSQSTAAFIVGLSGMAICQGIIGTMKSWRPFPTNGKDSTP